MGNGKTHWRIGSGLALCALLVAWFVTDGRERGSRAGVDEGAGEVREDAASSPSGPIAQVEQAPLLQRESVRGPEVTPTSTAPEPGVEVAATSALHVSGLVLDEKGLPFPEAMLFVTTPGSRHWSSSGVRSELDGRFTLPIEAPGHWRVGASHPEALGAVHVDLELQTDHDGLELRLERGGCVSGSVTWPDGTPAPAVSLILRRESGWSKGTTTNGASFELCGLPFDAYTLEALAWREGERGTARLEAVRPGETQLRLVLAPTRVFEVQVRILDESGSRLAEVELSATREGDTFSRTTDEGGDVVVLEPGPWTLSMRARGYLPRQEQIVVEGPLSLEYVLQPAVRILGTVVDSEGRPVGGAQVLDPAWGTWSFSDSAGNFEVFAPPGPVSLLAKRKEVFGASERVTLEVRPGEPLEGVVLTLRPACRLQGRVLDQAGYPAGSRIVRAGDPLALDRVLTGQDGRFEFTSLPPGELELAVTDREGTVLTSTRVILTPGETPIAELRLPREP